MEKISTSTKRRDAHVSQDEVRAHGLGVQVAETPEQAMERFCQMEKERIIEACQSHVQEWRRLVIGLALYAQALRADVQRRSVRESRLLLVVFGLALLFAYFYYEASVK